MRNDVSKLFNLHGRVAVVTGGGGELCGAMAKALGGAGVAVAVVDKDLDKAKAVAAAVLAMDGKAEAFACDVLNEQQLTDLRAQVIGRWGRLDLLINGAGGNDPRGSAGVEFASGAELGTAAHRTFFDLDLDGFRDTFALNFLGTFLPSKVFCRAMAEKGGGAVLNISSMSALTPLTKVGAYSAAKAAVANFTRWLAVHLAHTGVRVNALAPGFFMTEQLRFLHVDQATGELTARARQVIAHTPLQRYGDPEDLLGAMFWLLSDASRFVTGTVVPIDGGFSSFSI